MHTTYLLSEGLGLLLLGQDLLPPKLLLDGAHSVQYVKEIDISHALRSLRSQKDKCTQQCIDSIENRSRAELCFVQKCIVVFRRILLRGSHCNQNVQRRHPAATNMTSHITRRTEHWIICHKYRRWVINNTLLCMARVLPPRHKVSKLVECGSHTRVLLHPPQPGLKPQLLERCQCGGVGR